MRIIAGSLRGRKLVDCTKFRDLRPTSDKNREMMFSILNSAKFLKEISFKIDGARVLDLCCGSGALSFEALSRGADFAVLIDSNPNHMEIAKKNTKNLQLASRTEFLLTNLKSNLKINNKKFDLIFFDPPYDEDYFLMIKNLLEAGFISNNVLLIVEFKTILANQISDQICSCQGFKLLQIRKCSATTSFGFYHFTQNQYDI
jgi:16S rRNA (guanine966-N2)-methyltransferase